MSVLWARCGDARVSRVLGALGVSVWWLAVSPRGGLWVGVVCVVGSVACGMHVRAMALLWMAVGMC